MATYCVNLKQQDNGDHEVHREGCKFWPAPEHVRLLGDFSSCHGAVSAAKKIYPTTADGCAFCSPECNTG